MEPDALVVAKDGLPARSVGIWSSEKLHYVRRYLEIFATSMHLKFASRVYIDLFAGPGRCVLRTRSAEELDGSPLLALKVPYPFTQYHLVEKDLDAEGCLELRVDRETELRDVFFYKEDANAAIDKIVARIPDDSLCLAVIDPTGLHLDFSSLARLARGRRVDIIYLFPEGMCVKRNLIQWLGQQNSPLDRALGTAKWRQRIGIPDGRDDTQWSDLAGRPITAVLQEQLRSIGYKDVLDGNSVVEIKNRRNVPLYYLVFASKHPLGHELWEKAGAIHHTGQRHLPGF